MVLSSRGCVCGGLSQFCREASLNASGDVSESVPETSTMSLHQNAHSFPKRNFSVGIPDQDPGGLSPILFCDFVWRQSCVGVGGLIDWRSSIINVLFGRDPGAKRLRSVACLLRCHSRYVACGIARVAPRITPFRHGSGVSW